MNIRTGERKEKIEKIEVDYPNRRLFLHTTAKDRVDIYFSEVEEIYQVYLKAHRGNHEDRS